MVKIWETKDWRSGARAPVHGDLMRPELFSRSVNELGKGANTKVVKLCKSFFFFFFPSLSKRSLTAKLPENIRMLSA